MHPYSANAFVAGIPITKATGTATSVYIGCFTREYDGVMCRDPEVDLKYIATGTGTALLSNRLSWFYDLRGPSLTLDSACSSSLNAVHLACQGLKTGETNMVRNLLLHKENEENTFEDLKTY